MAWTPFSNAARFNALPVLLAGPIIRRAEAGSVSVWFVLKEQRSVRLDVFAAATGGTALLTGTMASGIALGNHLFIYLVTAAGATMQPGNNYYYDLDLGNGQSLSGLIAAGLDLTYDGSRRPSFSLPPADINQLRLAHGSCRKPHGEGQDAMAALHEMIRGSVSNGVISPLNRPHQVFLTGDQIYADDVADMLLYMIDDAAAALLGWDENFAPLTPQLLKPGYRNTGNALRTHLGLSAMEPLPKKQMLPKSHLLKFREYATMYLFAWSPVLWPATPADYPLFANVFPGESETVTRKFRSHGEVDEVELRTEKAGVFEYERMHVMNFRQNLEKIRKAMANVPVYMIFDDHEVTDDWNLNWRWCKDVYDKPLGRRMIHNGLLAYAIFQDWGNVPSRYQGGSAGALLLNSAGNWRGADDARFAEQKMRLNVPASSAAITMQEMVHAPNTLDWHYNYIGPSHAILVLDSRTWRSFNTGSTSDIAFCSILSRFGFNYQFPANSVPDKEFIIVLAPAPVLGVPFIEEHQLAASTYKDKCELDAETWGQHPPTFERLFSTLAGRLQPRGTGSSRVRQGRFAFLSGDVHYAFTARHQFWGDNLFEDSNPGINTQAVFAQLNSSAFKNQAPGLAGTETLHVIGYPTGVRSSLIDYAGSTGNKNLPGPFQKFGWLIPPGQGQRYIGSYPIRMDPYSVDWIVRTTEGMRVIEKSELQVRGVRNLTAPDWRYRIDYLLATNGSSIPAGRNPTPTPIAVPPNPANRQAALQTYYQMAGDHASYSNQWGPGKEIVGLSNMGEIRFEVNNGNYMLQHILWWQMNAPNGTPLQPFPISQFSVNMNFNASQYPAPTYP